MSTQLKKDTGDKLARFHDLISFSNISVWSKETIKRECIECPFCKKDIEIMTSVWESPIPIKGKNIDALQKEEHPAVFSDRLVSNCLELYTKEGDLVLDLMAGSCTTCLIAKRMKRRSIGIDIVPKYIEIGKRTIIDQKTMSPEMEEKYNPQLIVGDARSTKLDNESVDFIIFSPPYWDLYDYEIIPGQIGVIDKREDFNTSMFKVFQECFRVLKPEKYCVCVISDIRKTELIDLHTDMIKIAKAAGFTLWDIVVIKRNIVSRISRSHKASVLRGYSCRVHEFLMSKENSDKK